MPRDIGPPPWWLGNEYDESGYGFDSPTIYCPQRIRRLPLARRIDVMTRAADSSVRVIPLYSVGEGARRRSASTAKNVVWNIRIQDRNRQHRRWNDSKEPITDSVLTEVATRPPDSAAILIVIQKVHTLRVLTLQAEYPADTHIPTVRVRDGRNTNDVWGACAV